jgi:uncharacterized repeat protein (TIGR01451 family)
MVLRKMLFGGAAAIALGGGVACPGVAQAADVPQVPSLASDQASPGVVQSADAPQVPYTAAAQAGPAQPVENRWAPSLTIHKAHEDPADHAVAYTLWVKNDGNAPTSGTYTVVDSLPDGATYRSVDAGQSWNCDTDALRTAVTCRSDANLAPGASSDPITVHTGIADKDPCQLINIAAVGGGDHRGGYGTGAATGNRGEGHDGSSIHLAKDVLSLPCHREGDKGNVTVTVNVTGNNNGGRGGDSSGATANGNGHIHDVTGGSATAGAKAAADAKAKAQAQARAKAQAQAQAQAQARAKAQAQARAKAQAKARSGRTVSIIKHTPHRIQHAVRCHMPLRRIGRRR